jgi:hypothetical protein
VAGCPFISIGRAVFIILGASGGESTVLGGGKGNGKDGESVGY